MIATIKISNAILDAVEMTSDYYINKRPWLYKLACRAFKNIKSPYQYADAIHVLPVTAGRSVTLSSTVENVLAIIPGDHGTDCWDLFSLGYGSQDIPYIESQDYWNGTQSLPTNISNNTYGYNIVGNILTFHTTVTFDTVTILCKDRGELDGTKEVLIPEECLEAVSKFLQIEIATVELRDAIRRREVNYVATNAVKDMKFEYNILVRRTRGRLANMQEADTQALLSYFGG